MSIIVSNSREGEKAPGIPFQEDGSFYPYIMYFDDNRKIAYAKHLPELLDDIIPGYLTATEEERLDMRLRRAINTQSAVQAAILTTLTEEHRATLKDWELQVLSGEYNEERSYAPRGFWKETLPQGVKPEDVPEEEQIDVWTSNVPLVLIDAAYQPWDKNTPPPLGNPDNTNIQWLSPTNEMDFLFSLSAVNEIGFGTIRNPGN